MEKHSIQLDLKREQTWKFYAQIFIYLYCRALPREERPAKEFVEELKVIGGRLFEIVRRKGYEVDSIELDTREMQALHSMADWLMTCYRQSDPSLSDLALHDLEECRELLENAEKAEREEKQV